MFKFPAVNSPFTFIYLLYISTLIGLSAVTIAKLLSKIIQINNKDYDTHIDRTSRGERGDNLDRGDRDINRLSNINNENDNKGSSSDDNSSDNSSSSNNNSENDSDSSSKTNNNNDNNSNSNDNNNSNINSPITFTLHTDSKTLCRAVRTGPKGDLADRASQSRLALWRWVWMEV